MTETEKALKEIRQRITDDVIVFMLCGKSIEGHNRSIALINEMLKELKETK